MIAILRRFVCAVASFRDPRPAPPPRRLTPDERAAVTRALRRPFTTDLSRVCTEIVRAHRERAEALEALIGPDGVAADWHDVVVRLPDPARQPLQGGRFHGTPPVH